jgi:rhodanese-related sulfurtransferase
MREIDVHQLESLLAEGAALVDVREPAEYAEARVPGAVLLPMAQLPARIGELDKTEPVYLICRSGQRSGVMCQLLDRHGFDAVNVVGGTLAWVRAGKPFDQGPE